MRDLDGDLVGDEPVQHCRRTLDRHADRPRQCGRREQRGRCQDVDGERGAGRAAPAGGLPACRGPAPLESPQELVVIARLGGDRVEESANPLRRPFRRLRRQRARPGERDGGVEQTAADPMPDQGGTERRAGAPGVEPGPDLCCRCEQGPRGGRAARGVGAGEVALGSLDLAFLVEVRRGEPLVMVERGAGRVEDRAAVDDAQRAVHTQPEAFEDRREVPGIDAVAVDGRLAAHGLQACPIQENRAQRDGCRAPGRGGRRRRPPAPGTPGDWGSPPRHPAHAA